MGFSIIGTGSSVPALAVTNDMLSSFLDTSDEWISTRTGIRQRRILTGKDGDDLLFHAAEASRRALAQAGTKSDEIDMVICSTLQGDGVAPSVSCLLTRELGLRCGLTFDINVGCCGFLYALDMADAYMKSGRAEKVLVVSAEAMSRMCDWNDRSTCVLFGDAAAAAVLQKDGSPTGSSFLVEGNGDLLKVDRSAGNCPYGGGGTNTYISMNGQEIYIFAVSSIVNRIGEVLKEHRLSPDDIAVYFLHQANMRILQSARQKLRQPPEKFPHNIEWYGNTSSASIPLLLDEENRSGRLKARDKIILCAFGAGLASCAYLLTWRDGYNV